MQVLAASKNKISTLKGFPYLPVLEVSILMLGLSFRLDLSQLLLNAYIVFKYTYEIGSMCAYTIWYLFYAAAFTS